MSTRSLFAACATVVLCVAAIQTAEAYPVTARGGTTTVTGVYRPLDLDLRLVDGTDALYYDSGTGDFRFSATFSGTYTAVGYSASGSAGNWQLVFGNYGSPSFVNDVATNTGPGPGTITLSALNAANPVGRLQYIGSGDFSSLGSHAEDTPVANDYFDFYQTSGVDFLKVTCRDGITNCSDYDVDLLPGLAMLGPYIQPVGSGSYVLEEARANDNCGSSPKYLPCGGIQMRASSIPEPASLALVGLALSGLAWVRRRQSRG